MLACRSVARRWHMPCPILILAWITVLREKKRGRSRDRSDCLPITSPVLFPYTILLSWEKGRFHNSYTVFLVMPVFKWYIETAKNGTNRFWHGYDFYRCNRHLKKRKKGLRRLHGPFASIKMRAAELPLAHDQRQNGTRSSAKKGLGGLKGPLPP